MSEKFDFGKIDEHKVSQNAIELFKELEARRNKYKKYGPIFILVSGVLFLTLIFSLESKVIFLILWVISVIYCAALMIRSEYRYHKCAQLLGLIEEETDQGEEDEKII